MGDLESFSLIYQAQVLLTFSLSGSLNVAPTICKTLETVLPRKALYREFKISSMNSNKSSLKSTVTEVLLSLTQFLQSQNLKS